MSCKLNVQAVYDWINGVAPFENQEAFDNSGLQVGHPEHQVSSILLTLDVTEETVKEAVEKKAELIIAHHPLIFTPLKDLVLTHQVPRVLFSLIQNKISLIAAHTNMDQSDTYSGTAAVAKLLGLQNIRQASPYLFLGDLPEALTDSELQAKISAQLSVPVRMYGQSKERVQTLGIVGGSFSEGWIQAKAAGAQAFLTGEVRHHHAVEAAGEGILLYDCGHYATEAPMLLPLALGLQLMADEVKCNLQVHVSRQVPYRLS